MLPVFVKKSHAKFSSIFLPPANCFYYYFDDGAGEYTTKVLNKFSKNNYSAV